MKNILLIIISIIVSILASGLAEDELVFIVWDGDSGIVIEE